MLVFLSTRRRRDRPYHNMPLAVRRDRVSVNASAREIATAIAPFALEIATPLEDRIMTETDSVNASAIGTFEIETEIETETEID